MHTHVHAAGILRILKLKLLIKLDPTNSSHEFSQD